MNASLVKVRVPFRKSELAWKCPDGRIIRIGGSGPLPRGAVSLGEGMLLDLHTGRIYSDTRFAD